MEGGPSESIFLGLDEIQSILGKHRRASKNHVECTFYNICARTSFTYQNVSFYMFEKTRKLEY